MVVRCDHAGSMRAMRCDYAGSMRAVRCDQAGSVRASRCSHAGSARATRYDHTGSIPGLAPVPDGPELGHKVWNLSLINTCQVRERGAKHVPWRPHSSAQPLQHMHAISSHGS
eukprot:349679-Chlamydomonas_euryale.AAC.10